MIDYSVAIRTLGKAGDKYQILLNSIVSQTIQPKSIIVYLASGYDIPRETIAREKYVYVKKGMVAQRALSYDEIDSEYILFLDDDVYLPDNAVEVLFNELAANDGDVISPMVFFNNKASVKEKIIRTLTGREVCRLFGGKWANKVLRTGGFSYNNNPSKGVYKSQSNAGPCFLCRKEDFLKISFSDELWLDDTPYAFPDDQVMFYKMYKSGYNVLSSYDSGIVHMDASTTVQNSYEKTLKIIYSEYRNKLIFWHRFIFLPSGLLGKILSVLALGYAFGFQWVKYHIIGLRGNKAFSEAFAKGIRDGRIYLASEAYKNLERI